MNSNPHWTVPNSIIRKDLIPIIRNDPDHLERMSMRISDHSWAEVSPNTIDWSGDDAARYIFRQEPRPNNALGRVRFDFRNDYAVYLHNTPQPGSSVTPAASISSGCILVERIPEVVEWLLLDTPGWSLAAVRDMLLRSERRDVTLARRTPLNFVYVTA